MAIFNVVETDCGGDVTANFDLMVESGSTLYQIHTVATISPHGQVFENPAVQACGCNDVVCVAADSQVLLFQEECRKFLFSVGLDCLVDCVACNEQGDFLAVGDRGGGLHFMATAFQHTLISQQLIETNKLTSREQVTFTHIVFTAMSDEGACDLLVLAACGQVYHFQNLQLRQLKQALISKDVVRLRDLQKDIRVDMFDAMFAHSETTLYVHCLPPSVGSSILTAGAGETVLAMWNKTGEGYVCSKTAPPALAKDCAVTKVAVTKCGKSLFTLDSESHLMLWSTHTLTCMRQWNDSVTDFSLQETAQETTGVDGLKIVMLTMDQDGACSLQICSLPRLEPVCRLQLNKTAWLVSCPPSQESVLLVEGAAEETSSLGDHGDLIENLKVCCLTETLPETRFYKLLSKKLFDGAESFAKLFNLDVELVYKTKANYILDQLSLWGDSSLTPQADGDLLVQLKLCLVNIQDDGNIVECCIKAPLSNARDVFDLLNFARNRLENSQQVGNGKTLCEVERSDLLTKVLEMLHRLNTFIITFGVQHFTGERWEEFRKVCLLRESLRYLSLGHISKVVCLWSRHPREFEATMSCVVVEDMLANISAETPSKLLTCWLTGHLIPVIVRQCPAALSTLVSWLEQRARNLEILEKDDWPHNALHLCDLPVLQQFTSGDCDLRIASEILKEQLDDPTGAFKRLAALILHLREFIRFCSQYNCHLSFTEYLQETTETVAYRMLDRITATELIPDFIANTIRPYMAEHGLDDRILYQYVKSLTEWSFKMSLQLQETIWEVKAISIIGCIQNHNYKMDAILDVILKACIPWSSAMEELVKDGLGMKHPRVPELHERCRLVELRKMLYSYDLGHYNVSEPSNAQRLVYHIVSRDRVTAVSDALEVVKAYSHLTEDSVYLFRLRYLIDHHRHAESMELLHSLPQHQQVTCGKQLVIGTRLLLRNDGIVFNQQNTNALSLLHTRSSCDILQHLLTLDLSADDQEHFEELLSNLKNIHVLQVEFGEFVSYEDYCSDDMRQEMCKERLSERHASMRDFGERKPGLAAPSDCRVYRQAQVLRINRDVLYGQRTLDAIKMGNIDEAIHWCRLLCRSLPTQESAERMFDTARHLCSLLATQEREEVHLQKGLPWVVTDLASQAVTYCSADLLTDCLQLCRSTYLASDVLRQCQTEDYNVSIQRAAGGRQGTAGKDPFIEWVFDDYFQEDGLVMEASQVLASLYHYTVASVPAHSVRDDKSTLQQLASAVTPVISHLKDNGHLSLAVQYCQETVTTMMQHVTSQAMGFTDLSPPVKQQQTIDMELLKTIVPPSLAEISLMTSSLLMKVLSHWPVDHALVVGLLCNLPHKLALEILQKATKKLGFHYKHILAVVRAGKDFADMCREQKTYDAYQLLEMDAYWGHKLAKCKVSFKGVFGLSRIEKRQLLPQICRSRTVHATSIRQFCSDYALDEDEPLMMHLKHLLGQCAVVSPGGTAMQAIDHTLVTSLLSAATELIEDFHNTELLLWSLQKILPQIDPYDYTRLEFVLKHMSNISSDPSVKKHEKLLSFLCEYKRVAPPSSYELNYNTGDTKMVIENRALPAVADTRLPFHPLASGAPWKIISPELNADTLSVWLSVISLLQLSPNQLYITVIHNIVNMHLETSRDRELASRSQDSGGQVSQSSDSGFDASFLDTVQSFLLKMTSAETAVGCSNWVVKELPLGREKVAVAKFNMQLSVKWHQSAATEAERLERKEIHGKIFERYRRLATEQLLHALHLTHPDLLQLTHSPVKLIFHLYQHHSVLTQSMGSWVSCQPDIHKVADEIGDINQVNVNKIRLNLIEKWFRSTTQAKQDDLDVTLDATMCQTDDLEKYEDDSNLMRANYLLQYGPAETSTKFLLGLAFAENTSKISHLCRVRALRCLFSLTDSNTIERLSRMTLDHIRDVMCGLHYIVVLEQLQMSQTLKSFSKCNKLGLIKTILRSHSHKARAVRLAAELCLEYSIFEVQLWSNILKQLLAFHMLDFLQHVLIRLLPVSTLWQGSGIMAVWKGILMAPLLSAVTPVSGGPLHDCLGSLVLLHRCPLLQDLDLATFSRRYLQLDLPVCAVACAMLIPPSDSRTACLRQVLTPATVTRLHQQLGEWTLQSSIDPMVQQLLLSLWHLEEDVEDLLSDKSQLVVDH